VREFLEDRLRRDLGDAGVNDLHVRIAKWAEPHDWRTAAHHFAAAKRVDNLSVVLDSHIGTIVGSGAFTTAGGYLRDLAKTPRSLAVEVIKSRLASLDGDADQAMRHATSALDLNPTSEVAISNLAASAVLAGDIPTALELARKLADVESGDDLRAIGLGLQLMIESSLEGDLLSIGRYLEELADLNQSRGHTHYEGVSLLNASLVHRARGQPDDALRDASRAVDLLRDSSSGSELASALFSQAWPIAWLGDLDLARATLTSPSSFVANASKAELTFELAALESELGSVQAAERALEAFDRTPPPPTYVEMAREARLLVAIRLGDVEQAASIAEAMDVDAPTAEPGRKAKALALHAYAAAVGMLPDRKRAADAAIEVAERQGADAFGRVALVAAAAHDPDRLDGVIVSTPERLRPALGIAAELIVPHLHRLRGDALEVVGHAALVHRVRWRDSLRRSLKVGGGADQQLATGRLLEQIGTLEDVPALRALGKRSRNSADRSIGRNLARRLAPRVLIQDLGRVRIAVGAREVPAASVRRKVLALLCYLLTKPQMSATREEVMEALWPDMDPAGSSNSLNQTIYFLRRVIEPDYDDETSPGYVIQDSDLVFLDPELVDSSSRRCAQLIGQVDRGDRDRIDDLSRAYVDKFAVDFAYDEWAADYREWLHVSYLQIVEHAITAGIEAGEYEQTVPLARRALETDPRLESLALSLLKLLKGIGAHAAAAEQYERYSTLLRREIGVEPPTFDSL
jgi:DNA-binding SARP family transcriptional activator